MNRNRCKIFIRLKILTTEKKSYKINQGRERVRESGRRIKSVIEKVREKARERYLCVCSIHVVSALCTEADVPSL